MGLLHRLGLDLSFTWKKAGTSSDGGIYSKSGMKKKKKTCYVELTSREADHLHDCTIVALLSPILSAIERQSALP